MFYEQNTHICKKQKKISPPKLALFPYNYFSKKFNLYRNTLCNLISYDRV